MNSINDITGRITASYPAKNATDPKFLIKGLGSFWNIIFREKNTISGYTHAHAAEAIQLYLDLVNAISAYSVRDIEIEQKTLYYPLIIKRSQFNRERFLFEKNGAVFGTQPDSDEIFGGQTFIFGEAKTPSGDVWIFEKPADFKYVTVFSNRAITPSAFLIHGTDFVVRDNVLVFNQNIFENDLIPKREVVDDNGNVDEEIVLWGNNTAINNNDLNVHHGYIFDLNFENSEQYKNILISLYRITCGGGNISALKALFCWALNLPTVIESEETVQDISEDPQNKLVVTDKNVYALPKVYTLLPFSIGDTLHAGDILTTNVKYFDNVETPNWWKSLQQLNINSVAFSKNVFVGNYDNQLSFKNDFDIVFRDANGYVHFPVDATVQDTQKFLDKINQTPALANALQLSNNQSVLLNPVDFFMSNFLKENTAAFVFDFEISKSSLFFEILPKILSYVPKHVYLIAFTKVAMEEEVYDHLNEVFEINNVTVDSDFSSQIDDSELVASINADFKNPNLYGFEIALNPTLAPEQVTGNTLLAVDCGFQDGTDFPTGHHQIPSGATTQTFRTLLLGYF